MPVLRQCPRCDYETADEKTRFCPKCGSPLRAPIEFYDAFVSYRREGGSELAELVRISLQTQYGLNLFVDVNELRSGAFDEKLLAIIENSPCFLLILSKGSLDRCQNEGDWLRREIAHALKHGKRIVPVLGKGFEMPRAESLPEDIRKLTSMSGVPYDHQFRDAAIAKIAGFIRDGQGRAAVPPPLPRPGPVKRHWGRTLAATVLAGGLLAAGYFGWYVPEQARQSEPAARASSGPTKDSPAEAEPKRPVGPDLGQAVAEKVAAERAQTEKAKQAAEAAARAKAEQERADDEAARQAVAKGNLVVRSEPLGAEVSVGDGIQGTAPLMLKQLALGKYAVRVRLAGYEDWSGEAEVKADEFAEVSASLVRSAGTLSLGSLPSGVDIEVRSAKPEAAGESLAPKTAKTPAKLELPTGEYTVTFRRAGWADQAQTVAVKRRATATATAEFVPGSLTVSSEPSGAEIVQDGKVIGTTPKTWSDLPPGGVQLEVRSAGYKAAPVSGQIEARQTLRLAARLEKLAGPELGRAITIPGLNLELVPIAAGRFAMGSTNGGSDERPVTQVEITRAFWLGKTEVTQGQWEAVMGSNPSNFKGANRPVEQVSYDDVVEFCRKLTARERAAGRLPSGYEYTLPTEAQWEYACRAGTTGDYSFGNNADELSRYGNYCDRSNTNDFDWKDKSHDDGQDKTAPVGSYRPNAWGLYDMHGNVWEWCLDWYTGTLPGGTVRDPVGPSSGAGRVLRGGGWSGTASGCRSADRVRLEPGYRNSNLGFRLALSSVP